MIITIINRFGKRATELFHLAFQKAMDYVATFENDPVSGKMVCRVYRKWNIPDGRSLEDMKANCRILNLNGDLWDCPDNCNFSKIYIFFALCPRYFLLFKICASRQFFSPKFSLFYWFVASTKKYRCSLLPSMHCGSI